MGEKKRIAFYSILSSGHMNVCVSLAKAILDQHADKVDIYFVCDQEWETKLRKMDERIKLVRIEYDSDEAKNRMADMVDKFKMFLSLPHIEKTIGTWQAFINDRSTIEIDKVSGVQIKKINPDFLLCDQIFSLPAMQGYPYAFIASANPLVFGFDGYPIMGTDAGVDEKEKIKEIYEKIKFCEEACIKMVNGYFEETGVEPPKDIPLHKPLSKHFTVYSYPAELEYYPESLRKEHRLWQIDGPLLPSRIPKPFDLPEEFKKLPGKIIYLSLGSLFSAYVEEIQKMVDILDKLDHKYIVSKGPNGHKLSFPSNKFIGENYVNQLAVLQVCDLMIAHGGNNTFCENFYFGVPQIVTGVLGDQINNQKRITETGYGYSLDLMSYKENDLISTVEKALNDSELKAKLAKISERIQKENRISQIATKIVDYVEKL